MMARSNALQREAGYIDARPHIRQIDEILLQRAAGPYIGVICNLRKTQNRFRVRDRLNSAICGIYDTAPETPVPKPPAIGDAARPPCLAALRGRSAHWDPRQGPSCLGSLTKKFPRGFFRRGHDETPIGGTSACEASCCLPTWLERTSQRPGREIPPTARQRQIKVAHFQIGCVFGLLLAPFRLSERFFDSILHHAPPHNSTSANTGILDRRDDLIMAMV